MATDIQIQIILFVSPLRSPCYDQVAPLLCRFMVPDLYKQAKVWLKSNLLLSTLFKNLFLYSFTTYNSRRGTQFIVPPRLFDFILTPYLTTPKWTQLEYLKEHWIRNSICQYCFFKTPKSHQEICSVSARAGSHARS